LASAFLDAVGEDELRAWAAIDPDALHARATALDRLASGERDELPMFGLPVGVKDCFDTSDLPTGYGSPIYAGHRPSSDAGAVHRLRAAGAMIAGKTKTAEFAWMSPADTVNPLDPARTPGGSSSGSAASVGAHTIPIATGTQTAGSVNRPASYCGVLGYKPTFGSFPRGGVKPLSVTLDTVGLLARSVRDLQLAATVLAGPDLLDPTLRTAQPFEPFGEEPRKPRIGFARTTRWGSIEPEAQAAIEAVAQAAAEAGASVEDVDVPGFDRLVAAQTTIQWVESASALAPELASAPQLLSDELRSALHEGAAMAPERYLDARRTAAELAPAITDMLAAWDCVLTPSATGVPPLGLAFTGDPLFSRAWTIAGAPCVSVPLAWTTSGLPAGVQVVGAPFQDGRTLACAAWLLARLGQT
jgi:Asp-tRNA(Asn)/Glu-tRNA(Gln) amidotransferase A subunit family amidase